MGMIFLSSCSSMYKTGQTPDDVYYSPTRPATETVKKEEDTRDAYTYTEPDNNYLRMVVRNRSRWNTINDADYWYSYNRPYQYTNSYYDLNNWSYSNSYPLWSENYHGYNVYGNPYYYNPGYYGYHPGTVVRNLRSNSGPKPYMGGQTNTTYSNTNNTYGSGKTSSALGNTLRNVFTPNTRTTTTTSSGDTYSNPVRTFTPSTPSTSTPSSSSGSNSSSGRSSTGSSSSSSRPARGGGN